ncbi:MULTISPECIES: hypothetical protein [unclassified Thiomonas]|uniref:hypothetical protein n=1 Tax=unclassified Thiomonas TaxID=2625466 RepID=UPI0004DBA011|nr:MULTISPECIES: hypothetical protein [unclassified Thiomonas]CDW92751.1 exported hypothetical protein [Thiomonas sp. CB2]VDY05547.1 exported protein of unknown function [Thiomonas sp. Bio17B3]VDY07289.1 exported protein of unknown function [Thiomonas sp. Sup16B3]VDY13801.1 conserved exported protein of unknown function [Thiomonas sp. OC7]VDY16999.1 exported protein of unknown function [Thiomonas sp. CB2]
MNNIKFKKSLMAAAAGAVLATVGMSAANANSLLFPYWTTNNGAQSALSLSTDGSVGTARTLHYVYNYGPSCTHYDLNGSMTGNDLLQQSVASPAAGGFGLAVSTDKSTPAYFPLANQTGFLVVTDLTSASAAAISGDMAIVDPTTGLVAAYAATSNNLSTGGTAYASNEGNFSAVTQTSFGLAFYPQGLVQTSWYSIIMGDMNTAINGGRDWTATATVTNTTGGAGGVYNNDESFFSGTNSKTLTCAGSVAPTDLMTTAQTAAVGTNGGLIQAGWALVAASTPTAPTTTTSGKPVLDAATGVLMYKMELVNASVGGVFGGKQFLFQQN